MHIVGVDGSAEEFRKEMLKRDNEYKKGFLNIILRTIKSIYN